MSNLNELLEIKNRDYSEWKDHVSNLKKKYTGRRNNPDIEKQQEASRCLSALSTIDRVMDAIPEDNKWINQAIKVALYYHENDQIDKEIDSIISACKGDKDSIVQVSKGLPVQLQNEWNRTVRKEVMGESREKKKGFMPIIIVAIIVIILIVLVKSCGEKRQEKKTEDKDIDPVATESIDESSPAQTDTPTPTPTPEASETEDQEMPIPSDKLLCDFELDHTSGSHVSIKKGIEDIEGNKYDTALVFAANRYDYSDKPYYMQCYIYKEFSTFSGDVGYYDNPVHTQKEVKRFILLGDNEELYSLDIDNHTSPTHFSVDVSNVKCLEIRYGDGHGINNAMIVNGVFNRDGASNKNETAENTEVTGVDKLVMPDLVGMNVAEASDVLTKIGITAKAEYTKSDEYEKDIVFSQDIPAGTEIENNIVINLKVSSGH